MFWNIYDRIKQIFCRHEWHKVSNKMVMKDNHYIVLRTKCQCSKCGKVEYFD